MSQAGIVDVIGTHPEIPTLFVCNVGSAVPIANTLEILGSAVAAHSVPLETVGSGNTVQIEVQYSSAAASSVATNAGVASFDSTRFTVDANGYVMLTGGAIVESFTVDAFTAPGTNPVTPNGSGIVTVTGGQVAAGTTANVIRTDSLAANTYTIEIQRSQAVAVSTVGDNGVSHFNSTYFTVDSNGFVSVSGTGLGQTITGNTGGALSPTAGNWNIVGTGSLTSAGAGSTLTFSLTGLTNHNVLVGAGTATITNVPPSTAGFVLTSNGAAADPSFQDISASGAIKTITGNSGGAESPTAGGNFNILGTGSITVAGSANTETVQLTGLTNHSLLVGAGTATITNLGVATNGQLPIGSTGADPVLATLTQGTGVTITNGAGSITIAAATSVATTYTEDSGTATPSANNLNVLGSGSITTTGSGATITTALTGLTNHNVLVGAGTSTITKVAPSATSGVPLISQGSSADPTFGTAVVAGGGTGNTTFTAYSVICAGTTATGAFQNVSGVGTSGQVLTSNGAGALPSWQAAASSGINTINGDSGSVTGSTVTFTGASTGLTFSGASTTMTLGGTLVVSNGGTGTSSFNINGPVIANTTSSGALSSVTLTNQKFLVGNTSAAPTAKGLSINVQVFTSSGTYTPTAGMLYCIVECQGGGGGGGGAAATGASTVAAGGGGGGGGYARKTVSAATIGASQTVTIGAGGTAGSSSGGNGGNGGTTSLGAIVSAAGGLGGAGGAAGTNCFSGGGGPSTGSGGDVNSYGTGGGWGWGTFATLSAMGGTGGASALGGGAQSVIANGSGGSPGQGGGPYGGGGSGASLSTSQSGGEGGAGGAGIMLITEYVLA